MNNITISINLDTGAVDVNNPSAIGRTTNNKVEDKSDEKTCVVFSRYLLYKLADAGLLESLVAVEFSDRLKRNVWRFQNTEFVKEVCAKFFAEVKAEKQKHYQERMAAKNSKQVEEGATNNE